MAMHSETMEATTNLNPNFNPPWEIIIKIFIRLPVKSLFRFRSVSKLCNSLLTDPQFITKHLQNCQRRLILSHTKYVHKHIVSCPLSSLPHKPINDASKLVFDASGYFEFSDSYNGLFCVETDDAVFLWNPSTRQCRTLPDTPFVEDRYTRRDYRSYALGYDPIIDDYKVFIVLKNNYAGSGVGAFLYSLKTDSWKSLDGINWGSAADCCKYVNGVFYWLSSDRGVQNSNNEKYPMGKKTWISYLNTTTEVFAEMTLPKCELLWNPEFKVEGNISVVKGMLCLSVNYVDHSSFILFVLKDQGSWEKFIRIPNTRFTFVRPVYMSEDGEILLKVRTRKGGDEVVTYKENRNGLFKKVIVHRLNTIKEAYEFVDTLISPFNPFILEGVSE